MAAHAAPQLEETLPIGGALESFLGNPVAAPDGIKFRAMRSDLDEQIDEYRKEVNIRESITSVMTKRSS
jgi:hypothetical protein